mgnify:CR=1 FL=1
MRAIIYSNDNQECERAESLLKSVQFSGHDISVYHVGQDFSETGFKSEFGEEALKETMNYMNQKGMFV